MKDYDLEQLATLLKESDQYRIIKRYQRPEYYNLDNKAPKHVGAFLDIESTGLSHADDNRVESLFTETPSHTTVQAMSHTAVLLLCLPKANERLKSPNLLNHSRFIALCTI